MREDLLALTDDDLALLSNRGTVKRARREVDEASFTAELEESSNGDLTVTWSDGVRCKLAAGTRISEECCSCPAVEICRHLVRSVFYYQNRCGADEPGGQPADNVAEAAESEVEPGLTTAISVAPSVVSQDWNPGEITDESLAECFKPPLLKRAKTIFDGGILVELVKGRKPYARFVSLGVTLRFLVPNSLRYTFCNCIEEQPCIHVALAVWAFRELEGESGIVSSGDQKFHPPAATIAQVDDLLRVVVSSGLSGMSSMAAQEFQRQMAACRRTQLSSSEELIGEIHEEWERYRGGDARFSEEHVLENLAEISARHKYLQSGCGTLPFQLVTGLPKETVAQVSSVKLIGLGCSAVQGHKHTVITAYFQDADSGILCSVDARILHKEETGLQAFYDLARRPIWKNYSLSALASSQIVARGIKLSSSGKLSMGRKPFTVNQQDYSWSKLRAPVFAESIAELHAFLELDAPPYLGLRRSGHRIHVCALSKVENLHFSAVEQAVIADAVDSFGEKATIFHPYIAEGAAGVETVLKELSDSGSRCVYVSGEVTRNASGIVINPVAFVLESKEGRKMIQPFVSQAPVGDGNPQLSALTVESRRDPLTAFLDNLSGLLGEMVNSGLDRANADLVRRIELAGEEAESLGSVTFRRRLEELAGECRAKMRDPRWSATIASRHFLDLCLIWRIARDELAKI